MSQALRKERSMGGSVVILNEGSDERKGLRKKHTMFLENSSFLIVVGILVVFIENDGCEGTSLDWENMMDGLECRDKPFKPSLFGTGGPLEDFQSSVTTQKSVMLATTSLASLL